MNKFKIFTFGCQMNEDDSDRVKKALLLKGFEEVSTNSDADLIIINTCTVRQHAEDKALSLIGTLKKWKKDNKKLIVMGCAAERISKELSKRFPYIDSIVGAKSYEKIFDLIDNLSKSETQSLKIQPHKYYQYQTISRGCSMSCSYCIVPSVRGILKHIPFNEIIKEVKEKLKSTHTFEIILLGQTVNSYHYDKYDFTDLIKALSDIDQIKIINFMSPHPIFFNEKFFKEYEKNTKISRHIHLPLQSASDRILKLMKRGYTYSLYKDIVKSLRTADPSTSISTDMIVGFTTETEQDFIKSLKAIDEIKFSMVYCFKYSPRFKDSFPLDIPAKELEKRHLTMLKKAKKTAIDLMNSKKGSIETVIVTDFPKAKTINGYNCCIIDDREIEAGNIIKAQICEIKNNTLIVRRVYEREK